MKKYGVTIEPVIVRCGNAKGVKLIASSGDVALTRGASCGIATSSLFEESGLLL
jgi:hypothetical protein